MKVEIFNIGRGERKCFTAERDIKNLFSQVGYCLKLITKEDKIAIFEPYHKRFLLMDKECFEKYGKEKLKTPSLPNYITENKFSEFYLTLTTDCSLKCTYCFAQSKYRKAHYTPWEILKIAVDYISRVNKKVGVSFVTGGEPTLNFPLLQKIVNYIKMKLEPSRFEISTNGVLSSKELLWLANNFAKLQISCDGPPEIQNYQRPLKWGGGSSQYVEKTIKALVKLKKEFQTSTTLSLYSLGKEKKIFKYLWELGVPKMSFRPLLFQGEAQRFIEVYPFKRGAISQFKFKEWGDYFGTTVVLPIEHILDKKCFHSCAVGGAFVVGTNGKIYACPLFPENKKFHSFSWSKNFIIGKINLTKKKVVLNRKIIKRLSEFYKKVKKCRNCDLRLLCWGGCALRNCQDNGTLYLPSKHKCQINRVAFQYFFKYLINKEITKLKPRIEEKNGRYFLTFLYSNFRLYQTEGKILNKNLFLKVNVEKTNFNVLSRKILKWHRRSKKLRILLLSLEQKSALSTLKFYEVQKFLSFLKENRILFKITKPIAFSKKVSKSQSERFSQEYLIPKSCFECEEMFKIKEGKVIFCNGIYGGLIKQFFSRDEIYRKFQDSVIHYPPKCFFGKYYLKTKSI